MIASVNETILQEEGFFAFHIFFLSIEPIRLQGNGLVDITLKAIFWKLEIPM